MKEITQEDQETTAFTWNKAVIDYKVEAAPIAVMMPDGSRPTFSPLTNMRERRNMDRAVDDVLKAIPTVEDKGHRGHWINDVPDVPEVDQRLLAEISLRALEPKMSLETAFRLFDAPTVVSQIRDKLNRADKDLETLYYLNQAEKASEKSKASGNEESSKPSEGDSQDATTPI